MLFIYIFRNPLIWVLPLLIQIASYWMILRKMEKRPYFALLPVAGEMLMSQDLFRRMRSFYRPAFATAVLMVTAYYLHLQNLYALLLKLLAFIVYGVFLIRLYRRLSFRFGKGIPFSLGLIFLPFIFLPVLGFGKSSYLGKPEFPPEKEYGPVSRALRKAGLVLISAAETALLLGLCFFLTIMAHPMKPVVRFMMQTISRDISGVDDSIVPDGRENTLGADYLADAEQLRGRDYFIANSKDAKKVVVMAYMIGSNLEDTRGFASMNISQMKEATAKGSGLDFVIQAGGSLRWFTKGIPDESVGRYLIRGGDLTSAGELPSDLCMTEPENLKDFIVWASEQYPADRYMLILWDHGGGFATGYGEDALNKRDGKSRSMTASEIISAVRESGVTFDLIGFDACLMQDIEYASAFAPYADYYLASEEAEPGYGWYYTTGFGKLAEDPSLGTQEFGRSMISSFDSFYRAVHDGKPDPQNTLSIVDLTLVGSVYRELEDLYTRAAEEMPENPAAFAILSAARAGAYQFVDSEQVDLISYLTNLKKADYREELVTDDEIDALIDKVRACIVYHNTDSAEGINGLAADFPYSDLSLYNDGHEQYVAVRYDGEERFFNTFCSILASQKMKQEEENSGLLSLLKTDYTREDWYVKGFEDYDTTSLFVDIPLKETPGGLLPELPEKSWDTITDAAIGAYIVTDDGRMYLGKEHFDVHDADGHPLIRMQGKWACVNGHLVCYESGQPIVTGQGTIYRGTCKAVLNGVTNITLQLEWDPLPEGQTAEIRGRVTGYRIDSEKYGFMKKGLEQFKTGDKIDFLFDYYDEEGKYIGTEPSGHPLRITVDEHLTVKDEPFEPGIELEYFGVLTDVYQRELLTEKVYEMT